MKNFSNRQHGLSFSTTIILAVIISLAATSAKAQKHANVNRTWKMKVETSVGNGSPVFDLKHATDSTLTGTYHGQLGEAAVKGTLKIKTIHLEFSISGNLIEYDGTVDQDSMKGTVKLGSMGSGTFTGTRNKL
ncbi:MAG: hypothetical protein ACKVOQ_18765 [Cyclobacteriaceae bacterium]